MTVASRPIVEEIAVRLDAMPGQPQVRALVDFTYHGLRVKDVRVVACHSGETRVYFPDRPQTARCDACDVLVAITARHCPHCGARQPWREAPRSLSGRPRPTRSVVHPINAEVRRAIEDPILEAYADALDARDAARRAAG